jgi:hypothetical protein
MHSIIFHGQYCHGLDAPPITELGEHEGLEVGDKGLKVGDHPLGRRPSTYAAHANKNVPEPFEESNVQICNAKDPSIKLQAIQCCWFDRPVCNWSDLQENGSFSIK